jgi:argininosuccinate synthase
LFWDYIKATLPFYQEELKTKAYSLKKVSFEENKTFNKSKIENFIKHHSKQLNKS